MKKIKGGKKNEEGRKRRKSMKDLTWLKPFILPQLWRPILDF